ncbi:MAG: hypothetical protein GY851_22600 [bacterium]|nr:hypothetical protein [bacterium]
MTKQARAKQERIIEAVRRGLEGDAAVEFVRSSGYRMTSAGIARHLRSMGGRGAVQALVNEGKSNLEVLQTCFPQDELDQLDHEPPSQPELFIAEPSPGPDLSGRKDAPLYETRKMSVKVPADLFEAIRLAARAEGLSQNQLITDILTTALARGPRLWEEQSDEAAEDE